MIAGIAVVLAVGLAGCSGEPDPSGEEATSSPSPTAVAPVFGSDEEALAAAVEAYERYLRALDAVASGAQDAPYVLETVTEEYGVEISDSLQNLRDQGLRLIGDTSFDSVELAELAQGAEGVTMTLYVCLDSSGTEVIDANDAVVTPANRQARTPLIVSITSAEETPEKLLPNGSDEWRGDDFC